MPTGSHDATPSEVPLNKPIIDTKIQPENRETALGEPAPAPFHKDTWDYIFKTGKEIGQSGRTETEGQVARDITEQRRLRKP